MAPRKKYSMYLTTQVLMNYSSHHACTVTRSYVNRLPVPSIQSVRGRIYISRMLVIKLSFPETPPVDQLREERESRVDWEARS